MDTANMPYARCREASIVVAWAVGGEVKKSILCKPSLNVIPQHYASRIAHHIMYLGE